MQQAFLTVLLELTCRYGYSGLTRALGTMTERDLPVDDLLLKVVHQWSSVSGADLTCPSFREQCCLDFWRINRQICLYNKPHLNDVSTEIKSDQTLIRND